MSDQFQALNKQTPGELKQLLCFIECHRCARDSEESTDRRMYPVSCEPFYVDDDDDPFGETQTFVVVIARV